MTDKSLIPARTARPKFFIEGDWEKLSDALTRLSKRFRSSDRALYTLDQGLQAGTVIAIASSIVHDYDICAIRNKPPLEVKWPIEIVHHNTSEKPAFVGAALFRNREMSRFRSREVEWKSSTLTSIQQVDGIIMRGPGRPPAVPAKERIIMYDVLVRTVDIDMIITADHSLSEKAAKEATKDRAIAQGRLVISAGRWRELLAPLQALASAGRLGDKFSIYGYGAITEIAKAVGDLLEHAGLSADGKTYYRRAVKLMSDNDQAKRRLLDGAK